MFTTQKALNLEAAAATTRLLMSTSVLRTGVSFSLGLKNYQCLLLRRLGGWLLKALVRGVSCFSSSPSLSARAMQRDVFLREEEEEKHDMGRNVVFYSSTSYPSSLLP